MNSAATADTDEDASRFASARVVERFWELMRDNDFVAVGSVLADGVVTACAISFFTVERGTITHLREYWPDDYAAPTNRAHLVERLA